MASAPWSGIPQETSDLAHKVLQANKDHQYALKVYTERLEAELEAVDKLLAIAEQSDEERDVDAGGTAFVPESIKATGPFYTEARIEESPFWNDAERRRQYLKDTTVHPMKLSEIEALGDAVKAELQRAHAHATQQLGQPSVTTHHNVDIDWNRVATRVASSGTADVQRSATDYQVRWCGSTSSQWNHTVWLQSEITRLKELVGDAKQGEVNWVQIAHQLGTGRTPIDCMRYAVPRQTHTWTPGTDARLVEAVNIYGTANWMLVARMVSDDATASQCQNRYTRSLDPALVRGTWSEEEDAQLRRAVEVFGHTWSDVCNFVAGRNSEQCRDRWQDFVNPNVTRTKWTQGEDEALLRTIEQVGEGRWKEISRVMDNGRTDSMCRARYLTLTKRRQKGITTSQSPTPSETSRAQTPALNPSQQVGSATEQAAGPSNPRPKPRPRAKSKAQQDDGSLLLEESTAPEAETTIAKKAAPRQRKSRLAMSSTVPDDTEETPGTKPSEPALRGKKRAAHDSSDEPSAKKRRSTKGKGKDAPAEGTLAAVDGGSNVDPSFLLPSEAEPISEQPKRPKPTPRMRKQTAAATEADQTPSSTAAPSAFANGNDPSSIAPTDNSQDAVGDAALSTHQKRLVAKGSTRRKSLPASAPARKSARLASKSGEAGEGDG
ncbi:hypothetical protein BXZ70DRAFT_1038169 [Cristinia sonorae]|uniref:Uncharacterized protein n=1 Tax=Cristinia sonorae TaxID=1940300 RepID=A0A8K0UWA4_9AGAR|nr:hypothetical protein BXZ70DRAFT_1038169 [Cristinia sonorae]